MWMRRSVLTLAVSLFLSAPALAQLELEKLLEEADRPKPQPTPQATPRPQPTPAPPATAPVKPTQPAPHHDPTHGFSPDLNNRIPQAKAVEEVKVPRVVILPFKNVTANPNDAWISESFAESLTDGLAKVQSMQLIERSQIGSVLQEQAFGQSALADERFVPQVGKLLGANRMVLGSFQKLGDKLVAQVRIVDVDTGKVDAKSVAKIEGKFSELFTLQQQLAQQLITGMRIPTTREEMAQLQQTLQATQSQVAYEAYIKGTTFRRLGDDENAQAAIREFVKALQADPNYARAHAGLAETYSMRAQAAEFFPSSTSTDLLKAQEAARKAIALNPQLAEAHRALAQVLYTQKKYPESLTAAQQAHLLNPRDGEAAIMMLLAKYPGEAIYQLNPNQLQNELNNLGISLEDPWMQYSVAAIYLNRAMMPNASKERKLAIELLSKAQTSLPDYPYIPLMLGTLQLFEGNNEATVKFAKQAVSLAPANFMLLSSSGSLSLQAGDLTSAEYFIKRAIQVNPAYGFSYLFQADLYMFQGKETEALQAIGEAAKRMPEHCNVYFSLAALHQSAGRNDKAILAYRQALKYWKSTMSNGIGREIIELSLAALLAESGQSKEARALLVPLRNHPMVAPGARRLNARIAITEGQYALAQQEFENYLQLAPEERERPVNRLMEREIQLLLKHQQKPQDALILNDLGQVALMQKDYALAQKYYQQAIKLAPDNPQINYNMGYLHLHQNQWREAIDAFQKAAILQPDYINAHYNLGIAYAQSGDTIMAKAQWEKVLRLKPDHSEAKSALSRL
jgi:tetratricopeptide (TPR) repeat protein